MESAVEAAPALRVTAAIKMSNSSMAPTYAVNVARRPRGRKRASDDFNELSGQVGNLSKIIAACKEVVQGVVEDWRSCLQIGL